MADGFKIDTTGLDEVIRNLKEFTPRLRQALYADSLIIAGVMEEWAKSNADWTDRTAHARQFIKSNVHWVNTNELMVSISHGVDYGVYLELANEGKYAVLEVAIAEFQAEFIQGWKEIAGGAI